ncbi:unnamed protein product, partial [Closterium sp. NIES-53]
VGCKDLYDVELYGKQDPYVVLQYGNQQHRTMVHQDGHITPVWNETFQLQLKGQVSPLECHVWDKNKLKDSLIGHCSVDIQPALTAEAWDTWHPLITKRQTKKGRLRLVMKYFS